jgi:lysophospholipase L1-like esterase
MSLVRVSRLSRSVVSVALLVALGAPAAAETPAPASQDVGLGKLGARGQPLEDPSGAALASFYTALRAAEAKPGVVRVFHYGDSAIVVDTITGAIRRRLQARFGDGGHGFVAVGRPWKWYRHLDVRHGCNEVWTLRRVTKPKGTDGRFGMGGISAHTALGGADAWFATAAKGSVGGRVSRFEILYLRQPRGGRLKLELDGKPLAPLDTAGAQLESAVHTVRTTDGPHKLSLETAGGGEVRLFGVALERDRGLVYDSLGINGARVKNLLNFEPQHLQEQYRVRPPHLVVINFGTNETDDSPNPGDAYKRGLQAVLARVRQAGPGSSCLVMSLPDRANKRGAEETNGSMASVPRLVKLQREAAAASGCAFWSTFDAMGGAGSMRRWANAHLSGDSTHLTTKGAEAIADLFVRALVADYEAFKRRAAPAPAPAPTGSRRGP